MNSIDKSWVDNNIGNNGEVIIPEGVMIINKGAFQGNDKVKKIIIPNSVIGIAPRAFADCPNLQEVITSNNLEILAQNSFRNCPQLKSIIIPDKVKSIYPNTFGSDTSLESVTLNGNFDYLSGDSFINCDNLSEININDSDRIDYNLFKEKGNVKKIVIDGQSFMIGENEQLFSLQKIGEKVTIVTQVKETDHFLTQCINLEKKVSKTLNMNIYLTSEGKLCYAKQTLAEVSLEELKHLKKLGQTELYICGGEHEITPEEHEQGVNYNLYKIDDLIEIKSVILGLKKQIQIPNNKEANREKNIYSQIVRILSENITYDDWGAQLTKEEYETKTGRDYAEYLEKNKERDVSIARFESRNLLGLLRGTAVCQGFCEIIRNIAAEYGISVTSIRGVAEGAHEWNQVKLDGIWYDDDFTNYRKALAENKLDECHCFLMGTRADGKVLTQVGGYKTNRTLHTVGKTVTMTDKKNLLNYGQAQQQQVVQSKDDKPELTDLQKAITGYSNRTDYQQACLSSENEWKRKNNHIDRGIEISVQDR